MRNLKLLPHTFDYGQPHRGVRDAYSFLKNEGLISRLKAFTDVIELPEVNLPEKISEKSYSKIKHDLQSAMGSKLISQRIASEDLSQSFLLNVGGDHGIGLGTVHGLLSHHPESVIVWADAHGDINTPDLSPTGNFHGMPLAFILGLCHHPEFSWMKERLCSQRLILFGPRDLDPGEEAIISRLGIQYYSSQEINRVGAHDIISMALHRADPYGSLPIHLSFDVDLFDKYDIEATGTRVAEGPRLEEVFLMGGTLAETGRLVSMDVVEFNHQLSSHEEARKSAQTIIDFIGMTLEQAFIFNELSYRKTSQYDYFTKHLE